MDAKSARVKQAIELCDWLLKRGNELSPVEMKKVTSLRASIHEAWRCSDAQMGALERIEDALGNRKSCDTIMSLLAKDAIDRELKALAKKGQ